MKVHAPLVLLSLLFCLIFFTGGSSWPSEPQLMVLRPAALLAAALGILTLRIEHLKRFAILWSLFLGAVLLCLLHLVPLPFEVWSALPGRDVIVAVDQAAGLGPIARPLSMSPDGTLNALFSLSVPFAVMILATQLDDTGQRRALAVLLSLAVLSGVFGLLQATGSNIHFYPQQTATPGLFANRNHQGALLALIMPMAATAAALGFGIHLNGTVEKVLLLAIAIIAIPLVIITGSRSALVVLAFALAFSIFIWRKPKGKMHWKERVVAFLAIVTVSAGLVWSTIFASRDIALDRLDSAAEDLRWPVWQSIADALPHYWPWGTGIGSYIKAYPILEPEQLLRPTRSNHAHNEYLEIAFTAGLPGLLLLACAGLALTAATWRAYSPKASSSCSATLSRLGCAMIVLLAIASVTDYPTRTPLMAAVLAIAAIWASLRSPRQREHPLT